MNTVEKNALLSVVTLAFAGLALFMSQSDGETKDIPWFVIGGLGVITLLLSMLQRRRRTASPAAPASAGKKPRKRQGK
ncbi:MAG: hypothetical protein P4N41_11680 [Negativicutes bacterium]|nr:hypothetical protein [Negativicutes bacterium]